MYVDLTRLTDAELSAALPRLASAKGLVFDLRGTSAAPDSSRLFRHLSQMPLTSPQRLVPEVTRPDRAESRFVPDTGWTFSPESPYLAAPKVFLADATSVGAAESYLAMVQHYGLGAIVGAPTAGTDGVINQVPLPGGFMAYFTGMKVLRHDGTPLHGLGVRPDESVARTRAAVAERRDELMERALEVLKAQLPGSRSR
jgi:C-terminal processing protease CtpA/Prc